MTEINMNSVNPIITNGTAVDNRPQEIEMKHFSQGLRLYSPYGDAAGHAITQRMKIKISSLEASASQVNDVISMLDIVEGSSHEITFALHEMKKLAVEAATGTLLVTDRAAMDKDLGKLFSEIQRIATESSWAKMTLMSGRDQEAESHITAVLAAESANMPLGDVSGQTMSINLKSWDPSATVRGNAVQQEVDPVTGLQRIRGNQFTSDGLIDGGDDQPLGDVNMLDYDIAGNDNSLAKGSANRSARSTETQAFGTAVLWAGNPSPGDGDPRRLNILSKINAEYVLANIDKAISAASDERDRLNAYVSRLEGAGEQNRSHNRIDDAGYAAEASEVSRTKIIAQPGAGMSAQANAGHKNVLTFLMK